ncbi:MAG: polysaccharide export protein [Candidatus Omnitrophica bacterium]|nr:polysaccharide export protein [Candidatus Omnitrophota bacterium]
MNHFYRTLCSTCLAGAWMLMPAAGVVHGQNFAGTAARETAATPPAQQQETTLDASAPLAAEPPAGTQDTRESSDAAQIPEEIKTMSHYTLGKTDVLEVTVMRHPEVSGQFPVNNEGNIQYEFVGDVRVEGMTKDQVKDALAQKLSPFILSPEITVKIVGYNSKVVYVVGEVNRPGKIFMQGDTMTVHEALVQAGLPLLSAKMGGGRVVTPSESGNPVIRRVNVEKLLYEGDLRENLVMNPGDTLYVPPTFLAKTMRVLQPVAAPIGTAAGTGRTVMGVPGF